MHIQSSQQLLALKLHHIEDAETEATRVMQEMRTLIEDPQFHRSLDRRLEEGREVLQGIRRTMPKLGSSGGAMEGRNRAARGILEDARSLLSDIQPAALKEAAAIGALQSLEHYCIATWGTVKALAREAGEQDLVRVMDRALDSGKQLDLELTHLAEQRVNPKATHQSRPGA